MKLETVYQLLYESQDSSFPKEELEDKTRWEWDEKLRSVTFTSQVSGAFIKVMLTPNETTTGMKFTNIGFETSLDGMKYSAGQVNLPPVVSSKIFGYVMSAVKYAFVHNVLGARNYDGALTLIATERVSRRKSIYQLLAKKAQTMFPQKYAYEYSSATAYAILLLRLPDPGAEELLANIMRMNGK